MNSVTILHVCGNVNPILNYMADCGFEGLSVEEKIGSAKKAKEVIGTRARLVGNVSSPFTLLPGPIDKIKAEAKQAIADGVDVLAPGCGIAPMTLSRTLKPWSQQETSTTPEKAQNFFIFFAGKS